MRWKQLDLAGWGRVAPVPMPTARPERQAELDGALRAPGALIARGAGRSYGDCAVLTGGSAVLNERLDRIVSFNAATGEVVTEAGVTFADLAAVFLPRGFMAPASPGTAFATIGGAIAADVHGKNHDRHGSFGDHVRWFDLLTADGQTRRVSPFSDPELFAATIGGMGLTGIIRRACFTLLPAASQYVRVHERRVRDLEGFLAAFAEVRRTATFSVGWIDAMGRGFDFARGIMETAEFAENLGTPKPRRPRPVPFTLPTFALNPLTVRLFNEFYYGRVPRSGRERERPFVEFLYPLDSLLDWYRIYGKPGFYQFQCVLPDAEAPKGLQRLLEEITAAQGASFLAVLKTLGGPGRGHLSFPISGYTLALDFPRRSGTEDLLARLERITLDHGGRIYLAKDQTLSRAGFRAMYPRASDFEAVLARVDPQGRFASDQSRRLGILPQDLRA
ncbi:MAG: FAD-binding oxidoreductase [Alphaproteobacteria bacterium]|nr:FAD-binding oxidoreductase [Alphaproteobacteria bacterium]